jgi:hypothetical protein
MQGIPCTTGTYYPTPFFLQRASSQPALTEPLRGNGSLQKGTTAIKNPPYPLPSALKNETTIQLDSLLVPHCLDQATCTTN